MRGNSKNEIIIALSLLMVIFFISSISSCQSSAKQKKIVNQEKRLRMGLEEKAMALSSQNLVLEQKIIQLEESFKQEELISQAREEALKKEISGLEEGLAKVNKLKERLEDNLKEALIISGSE
ncbi:MAG: hypothetical protein ABIC18_01915 [Candidatus Omnitrophota bacterium]